MFALVKLILSFFSCEPKLPLIPKLNLHLILKKLFFRLSLWDDELLSTPKIITFLLIALSKLHEPALLNAIPYPIYTIHMFVLKTVLVTKPLVSDIFYQDFQFFLSKFCLSVLHWLIWTNVVGSGIFFSKLFNFVFNVLNFAFSTTSLSTTSLNVFKFTGTVFNFPTSKRSTFVFKLFRLIGKLLMFINVYQYTLLNV